MILLQIVRRVYNPFYFFQLLEPSTNDHTSPFTSHDFTRLEISVVSFITDSAINIRSRIRGWTQGEGHGVS